MKKLNFFATCPKGLEQLLEEELQLLGAAKTKQTVAGVSFIGPLALAYKACLWSRLASRILLPVANFSVHNADTLQGVSGIQWSEHMTDATSFMVNFSGVSAQLSHTQFSAQKVKDAIVDQFRKLTGTRPSVDKENPMLRINALLTDLYINLSKNILKQGGLVKGS